MEGSVVVDPGAPAGAGATRPSDRRDARAAAIAVALLTIAGAAIRIRVAHQALFADELATYWDVTAHGFGRLISTVHGNAEIAPPLPFILTWLAGHISHSPTALRLPALVAGTATIPLVYLVGRRLVGGAAGLTAAALTTFAPFMVYYSAEARGYGVMMAFVALSTLALVHAADTGRRRWWILYVLATAAAAYSHYVSVFVLAAQLAWTLVMRPGARRPALLATAAAGALYLPWTTGVINDLNSPTTRILSALSPFDAHTVRVTLEHWSIGYPYGGLGLRLLPGDLGLLLIAGGTILALARLGTSMLRTGARSLRTGRADSGVVLAALLFLAAPVAEAAASAVSTHLFSVRNLAASWFGFALLMGALLSAAGPRLRYVSAVLVTAGLALGAVKMFEARYSRPDYAAAARFVDKRAQPGDVLVDGTARLSPGPSSALDAVSKRRIPTVRGDSPQETDHPFTVFDPSVPIQAAISRAGALARGRRIFLVALIDPTAPAPPAPPRGYHVLARRTLPGIVELTVQVYAR